MIVQLIVAPEMWSCFAMLGIAMFTAVMSRMTISCATSKIGSSQFRGCDS